MPYARIWVHAVFSTKNRIPFLKKNIRKRIWDHILFNGRSKNIYFQDINGYTDHAHCLFQLGRDQTLSKVMNLIKGESSNWINKQKLTEEHFSWQTEYWAASVSDRDVERVKKLGNYFLIC